MPKKGVKWSFYKGDFPWLAKENGLKISKSGLASTFDAQEINGSGVLVFSSYLKVPETGRYQISLSSKEKAFVRIHDAATIDADFGYTGRKIERTILLQKGIHPIKVYQLQKDGEKNTLDIKFGREGKLAPIESALML
ncbi:PA14 domain-containing protein [Pedobacter rhizosphaerae]|uniref:PA14 domain-containing protein n=1 Tax=Pedobacter rhizosphaerae TaxID=390241 RepID=A0A1H9TG57_9SPHI|nr:PA14 domain-containing protein [Pedobacter rhizosphaerae]SER95809.1 PA14 domain-containing protein [Pedobacter rhizosphaerae]